jgi:hypothetical protein
VPSSDLKRSKFAVHGPSVEIDCTVPEMSQQVRRLLEPFSVASLPEGFAPTVGIIRPHSQSEVLKHLSPGAKPLPVASDLIELYEDGDRYWVVDDRWGMAEVNMIRGQFRSWILNSPRIDPIRCAEMAILWPLAQLLRSKGLYLLPAASVVRDGWAALVVCPFTLESELVALIRSGYKVIGQRWTALREEEGRLALLHLPGAVERSFIPRLRSSPSSSPSTWISNSTAALDHEGPWIDLAAEHLGSWQNHAFCDAVLVAEGGRRGSAFVRDVDPGNAINVLRRAWPLVELHPQRRWGHLPLKLAQQTRVCELQLSRSPRDLLDLLSALRSTPQGQMLSDADRDLSITPWAGLRPRTGVAA